MRGTRGVMTSGNCDVAFSFGEVPVLPGYAFLWRQPGYSWGMCQPNGNESLADLEASDWQVAFELE